MNLVNTDFETLLSVVGVALFFIVTALTIIAIRQYEARVELKQKYITTIRDLQQEVFNRDKNILALEQEIGSRPATVIPDIPEEELKSNFERFFPLAYENEAMKKMVPMRISGTGKEAIVNCMTKAIKLIIRERNDELIHKASA